MCLEMLHKHLDATDSGPPGRHVGDRFCHRQVSHSTKTLFLSREADAPIELLLRGAPSKREMTLRNEEEAEA